MSKTIDKCAKQTTARDHKLKVFALQFYGECYSGYDGLKTYNKYGAKYYSDTNFKNCWSGVGAINTNFVYKFKEWNGEHTEGDFKNSGAGSWKEG